MWIYVNVDTNDADYVGLLSEISEEDLRLITPLIEAIKAFKPYTGRSKRNDYDWHHSNNYPTGEVFRPDLGEKSPRQLYPNISDEVFEVFEEYCPSCEWGFHTIKEINLITNMISLL